MRNFLRGSFANEKINKNQSQKNQKKKINKLNINKNFKTLKIIIMKIGFKKKISLKEKLNRIY